MLSEYLNEKTIQTNIRADDWRQAIRKAGQILVDDGSVQSTYVDAMIRTEDILY